MRDHERELEKKDYLDQIELSARKQKARDDAQGEYWRELDGYLQTNADMHTKMVLDPYKNRLKMLNDIEDKNQNDYLRKQNQRYDNDNLNTLKHNQEFLDENDRLLKERQFQRELEAMKIKEDDMYAKGEKHAMDIGKDMDYEEDRIRKNLYKQTLLYQQAMNQHNKHNFGKMTYAGNANDFLNLYRKTDE